MELTNRTKLMLAECRGQLAFMVLSRYGIKVPCAIDRGYAYFESGESMYRILTTDRRIADIELKVGG